MKAIVIGAGAAGCMAAARCAENGLQTTVLERNEKIGKKIYITGKGRCNLTNACGTDEFLSAVVRGGRFLRSALSAFPPERTMSFFGEEGLPLKTERGGRVFPASDKASDVIKTLSGVLARRGVDVIFNTKVAALTVKDGAVTGVVTESGEKFFAERVIVATGGLSYPATGSAGDGLKFAKTLGLKTVAPVPALTGILTETDAIKDAVGLSLKNVRLSIKQNNISTGIGEALITHTGISGPCALTLSSFINRLPAEGLTLSIDFKPALDEKTLDARILRDFAAAANKALKNSLSALLPKSLISAIIYKAGADGDKKVNQITAPERAALTRAIKNFTLPVKGVGGFEEAVVTSGGVDLSELNPKNMECKNIKGLRFAGEVIDADALTGGFNLQIAFATGYAAGG